MNKKRLNVGVGGQRLPFDTALRGGLQGDCKERRMRSASETATTATATTARDMRWVYLLQAFEALVRRRAYELYEQRGKEDGHHLEDWLQAESELLQQGRSVQSPTSTFNSVELAMISAFPAG